MTSFFVLNLPSKFRLTRRYMCSYESTIHLFPPLELLSCAAIIRQYKNMAIHFLDAIAKKYTTSQTVSAIKTVAPDYVITLIGFECFEEDMKVIEDIKLASPNSKIIVFGHYATVFKQEILEKSNVDIIFEGEPEMMLVQFLENLTNLKVNEISQFKDNINNQQRIRYIADLPAPAYDLLEGNLYSEAFMPKPFGMVQSARGCPYTCNYCVRSYGSRLSLRSPEQVIEEIRSLIAIYNIKSLRFIDDTFTINHQRVIDICRLMIENKFNIEWTCLSRTDNIKPETLKWMKKAGCRRIYFGIESGSQRMLDLYEKGINVQEAKISLLQTRAAGIETTGFFMLGLPDETESDFNETLRFALSTKLSLASVGGLVLYPGTPLFKKYKSQVEFSLFPYVNRFIDPNVELRYRLWAKTFYKSFYYRPSYLAALSFGYMKQPAVLLNTISEAIGYSLDFGFMPGIMRDQGVVEKTIKYHYE